MSDFKGLELEADCAIRFEPTVDTFVIHGTEALDIFLTMVRDTWARGRPFVIECHKVIFEPDVKEK